MKAFPIYLIIVAITFFLLEKAGFYNEQSAHHTLVNIKSAEKADCYQYVYFLKADKKKTEYTTQNNDLLDERIHEIFTQKINCQ